jgi:arsenate reductase-like glutaredoxin family protein
MQGNAARDLERMARDGLGKAGLISEGLKAFAGPRRLTLVVEGLPIAQPDVHEELKGPKVGAPDQAMDGFLRKTGLTREQLVELYARAGMTVRQGLRAHSSPAAELNAELGLADASDDAILDAMMAHPVLINRPLVETEKGVRLCRPQDVVHEIL